MGSSRTDLPAPAAGHAPVAAARYAELSQADLLSELGTTPLGLSEREASYRRAAQGPNDLPRPLRRPWYADMAASMIHLFAVLLWAGAALAWVAGLPQLGWAIIAVILINGLFTYWQEYQAERAAEALQQLLPRQVRVRREGRERLVPASHVVPGDLLVLTQGEAVPADARLILAEGLRIDASALTGESKPVSRIAGASAASGRPVVFLSNLVLAGGAVTHGRGEAVVFGTGAATEFGRIAQLTHAQRERPSPLQKELRVITRVVTVMAVVMGSALFVVARAMGGLSTLEGALFAIGIIVANVPEGLLPTLTMSLALGVRRMAARNALLKRLSSVETLGATTVIVTDKTGTLTENEMTVRETWAGGASHRLTGQGYERDGSIEPDGADGDDPAAVGELLRIAALCCDAQLSDSREVAGRWAAVGDSIEIAILVAAAKAGLSPGSLAAWPRVAELPFDSIRKRMTTVQRHGDLLLACVKGATSEILPRCTRVRWGGRVEVLTAARMRQIEAAREASAGRGLRVLAVASRVLHPEPPGGVGRLPDDVEGDLTFLGLLAMEDPPRREVPAAIAACRQAGVRVIMATGDDGTTAAAIGRQIGLHSEPPVLVSGADVDRMDGAQLDALLERSEPLFARVTPEHKLRLVEALQRRGEVVAVTGDGVNDAPALKRADIGVAMGIRGTDVAREAADMVLADDNFASIVAAIEEGRGVYDNVRKFMTYILASNIPELVPFVAFVVFRIPLPLTIMQVLAVDLGTDLLPALALGAEPPEADVMKRPPRPRTQRLLDARTLVRAYGWLGMLEAGLSMAGFFCALWLDGWRPGLAMPVAGPAYTIATTMTLAGIVSCQVGNLFACRSERESALRVGLGRNRLLVAGIVVELALLLALMHAPPLAGAFGVMPLEPRHWIVLAAFGPVLLMCEEARKALRRRA